MITKLTLIGSVAAIAAACLANADGTLKVGDKIPNSKLNEIVWNWDGAESINEYLGEPILVDFWGKN
ncbi:MAG: hypothetical protein HY286_11895 [Planctomycetes bacterium]|nr:hypothetical protein [Planctomycetota bacterium]